MHRHSLFWQRGVEKCFQIRYQNFPPSSPRNSAHLRRKGTFVNDSILHRRHLFKLFELSLGWMTVSIWRVDNECLMHKCVCKNIYFHASRVLMEKIVSSLVKSMAKWIINSTHINCLSEFRYTHVNSLLLQVSSHKLIFALPVLWSAMAFFWFCCIFFSAVIRSLL